MTFAEGVCLVFGVLHLVQLKNSYFDPSTKTLRFTNLVCAAVFLVAATISKWEI